ncbi:hypothetical protein EV715DRAFT_294779 [Schizophyllum commune]
MSSTIPSVCPKNAKVTQRGVLHDASSGHVNKRGPAPAQRDAPFAYSRVDRRARKRTRSQGGASQTDVAPTKRQKKDIPSESVIQKPAFDAKHATSKSGDVVFKPKPNGDDAATPLEPARGGAPGHARMARPKVPTANAKAANATAASDARSACMLPATTKPAGPKIVPTGDFSFRLPPHAKDERPKGPLKPPAEKHLEFLLSYHLRPTQGDLALQAKREEPAKRRALERKRSTYVAGDDDSKLNASNKQYGYYVIHNERGLTKRV